MPRLRRALRIAVSACLSLMLAGPLRVAAESLVIYGPDDYPPLIFLDHNKKPTGVLVHMMERISMETGDHYDIRPLPWNRAYKLGAQNRGALIPLSDTSERRQRFDYSAPLYVDHLVLAVRTDHVFPFDTLADLKDKLLAGALGSSYGPRIDAEIKSGQINVSSEYNVQARLKAVLGGRVDAAVVFGDVAGFESSVHADPQLAAHRSELMALPKPLTSDTLYLGIPKSMGRRALLDRFNAALDKLQGRGEFKKAAPEDIS